MPTREQTESVLRRWRVGAGDRIVFYDDVGLNRQAIRGYWLMRLYGFPTERLHILDGGLDACALWVLATVKLLLYAAAVPRARLAA